ncbi:MAG: hypothetical protein WAM28_02005, partial [Chlamydiales bacterium]
MIPVNSPPRSEASNSQPATERTAIDKHIRQLLQIQELINPYLTGKEAARFKATCSPLSHLSLPLLGKFRVFLERRLAE